MNQHVEKITEAYDKWQRKEISLRDAEFVALQEINNAVQDYKNGESTELRKYALDMKQRLTESYEALHKFKYHMGAINGLSYHFKELQEADEFASPEKLKELEKWWLVFGNPPDSELP